MYRAVKHTEQPRMEDYEDAGQFVVDVMLWVAFDRRKELIKWFKKNKYAKLDTTHSTPTQRDDGRWVVAGSTWSFASLDRLEAHRQRNSVQSQRYRNHYFNLNIKRLRGHKEHIKAWENGALDDGKVFKDPIPRK